MRAIAMMPKIRARRMKNQLSDSPEKERRSAKEPIQTAATPKPFLSGRGGAGVETHAAGDAT